MSVTVGTTAGPVRIRCSTRADGDFHRTNVAMPELESRRRSFVDLPWTMLDQRHGTTIVRVDRPGAGDGHVGDVAVTDLTDAVLGCWVADCAPIVLVGADATFATVHAGWRGLVGGVIDRAVEALHAPLAAAVVGPTIGPCCYEFGDDDLAAVAAAVGTRVDAVASRTTDGARALDMNAAVAAACSRHGVVARSIAGCPGCTHPGYSHRVRREPQRHVVAAWRPAGAAW